jgi:hypothetical protein
MRRWLERALPERVVNALYSRGALASMVLAFCLAIVARSHAWLVRPYAVVASNDEGYIAAMALRMIRGHWLPYVDGVSQRGPLLYWVSAAFLRAGGIWTWLPMRALGFTLAALQVLLSFALALELGGALAAALCAVIVTHLLCFELIPWDGAGVNGEPLGSVFALASALVLARAQLRPLSSEKRRAASLAAAGALGACAALSKQMFVVHALASLVWIALGPAPREDDAEGIEPAANATETSASNASSTPSALRARLSDATKYSLGFMGPFAIVTAIYAASGHLRTFVYYFQQYGREVFMDPVTMSSTRAAFAPQIERSLTLVGAVALGTSALVGRALSSEGRLSSRGRAAAVFVALNVALGFAGALFTTRFFGHYFVQVIPWVAMVAALLVGDGRPREAFARGRWAVVVGAIVVCVVGNVARGRQLERAREHDRWFQDPADDPISRYLRENTTPEQTVFVWGFRAETYLSAERWPASRYVYTVYPAGVVPWFSATRAEMERRVVAGSRETLLAELEREKPELLVDAGRTMLDQYMYNYPVLRAYIDQRYCLVRYVDGEPIYRRKRSERCEEALR